MDKIKEIFERFPKVEELYYNQSTGEVYFHREENCILISRSEIKTEVKINKKSKK